MKATIKVVSLILVTCVLSILPAIPQKNNTAGFTGDIVPDNSTHIGKITADSIVVITGSTYSFTVDTHPDSGQVSTRTTVSQLLSQVKSKNASIQHYTITNGDGIEKKEGELLAGDRLIVSSADGKIKKTYFIGIVPMAISGRLLLDKHALTTNTHSGLTIDFTA